MRPSIFTFSRSLSPLSPSIKASLLGLGALLGLPFSGSAAEHPGAVIYKSMCIECHGAKGEGVAGKYEEPIFGTRTLASLTRRIEKTMPEGNEGSCVGEDAEQVAAYIYDAFYSQAAQARIRPPEIELARLTVPQYQTAIADIVGRFRPGFDRAPTPERGLKGTYSGIVVQPPEPELKPGEKKPEEKKIEDKDRVRFDRVDGQLAFKFGAASPDPARLDAKAFNGRWDGSVIAEETGTYEFVVKSENGLRLWVNDMKNPLIDAWVSSGADVREEKKSIFLLGGRSYPIMVEFFKFNEEKTASIELLWKPPHGVVQSIPQHNLWPTRVRQTMVLNTSFPADDSSVGYARGTGVSKSWDQATTDAAIEVAEYVETYLDELSGSKTSAPDRLDKLKGFSRRFAEAAFRRPLSPEQQQRIVDAQFQKAKTPELAVKRVVLFTLKSPYFLYPDIPHKGEPDAYEIASRLSFALWDSVPDQKLLQAAAEGKLKTHEQITAQARRMISDLRTKTKLQGFFHHWLELERAEMASKDAKMFPGFDESILADLRTSLSLFLDQVVWSEKSDYRELLQANYILLNNRLAKFYGKESAGSEFKPVAFDPRERTGVLTHPYLLAAMAYNKQSSPIHRGVFLTRNIVGMTLNAPPNAVAFEDSHFDPTLTMREKVTQMTKDNSCMACHSAINPLGFSLENFDAVGRWRNHDNSKPVDSVSEFATEEGKTLRLTGPRDVAQYAISSENGHRAFIRHLFNHTIKQQFGAYGQDTLDRLRQSFETSSFNIQKLLVDIALVAATNGMPAPQPVIAQAKPTPPPQPAVVAPKPADANQGKPAAPALANVPAPAAKVEAPKPAPAPAVPKAPENKPAVAAAPAPMPKPAAPVPAPAPKVVENKPVAPVPANVPTPAAKVEAPKPAPAPAAPKAPENKPAVAAAPAPMPKPAAPAPVNVPQAPVVVAQNKPANVPPAQTSVQPATSAPKAAEPKPADPKPATPPQAASPAPAPKIEPPKPAATTPNVPAPAAAPSAPQPSNAPTPAQP